MLELITKRALRRGWKNHPILLPLSRMLMPSAYDKYGQFAKLFADRGNWKRFTHDAQEQPKSLGNARPFAYFPPSAPVLI
jgi:hypothetical protein